jgi:hypothetical protein
MEPRDLKKGDRLRVTASRGHAKLKQGDVVTFRKFWDEKREWDKQSVPFALSVEDPRRGPSAPLLSVSWEEVEMADPAPTTPTAPDGSQYTVNWETRRLEPAKPPRPIIEAGMLIGFLGENEPRWLITPEGKWAIIGMTCYAVSRADHGLGKPLPAHFAEFTWPATPAPILSLDEAAVRAKYGFQAGDVVSIKGEGEFQHKHSGRGIVDDFYVGETYPYRVVFLGRNRDDFDWFRHDQLTLIEPSQGLPRQGLPQ